MKMRFYRDEGLHVPERMTRACKGSDPSRQVSELVHLFSCSRPELHETDENCSG